MRAARARWNYANFNHHHPSLILKKTSHTSFFSFETSKLVSPQFLPFTLFCFREKNGEETLQLTSINFVYMRLPDFVVKRIYLFNIVAWNYRKKIGFPVCKKENFAGLQAHRKRGKSARASRFTAQHLSALLPTTRSRIIHGLKVLWVVSFPRCTVGANIVEGCCVLASVCE